MFCLQPKIPDAEKIINYSAFGQALFEVCNCGTGPRIIGIGANTLDQNISGDLGVIQQIVQDTELRFNNVTIHMYRKF